MILNHMNRKITYNFFFVGKIIGFSSIFLYKYQKIYMKIDANTYCGKSVWHCAQKCDGLPTLGLQVHAPSGCVNLRTRVECFKWILNRDANLFFRLIILLNLYTYFQSKLFFEIEKKITCQIVCMYCFSNLYEKRKIIYINYRTLVWFSLEIEIDFYCLVSSKLLHSSFNWSIVWYWVKRIKKISVSINKQPIKSFSRRPHLHVYYIESMSSIEIFLRKTRAFRNYSSARW